MPEHIPTLQGFLHPTAVHQGDRIQLTWKRDGLPAYGASDSHETRIPAVYLSSLQDWGEVDTWYQSMFNPQTHRSSPIRIRAQQIMDSVGSRRDRIARVLRLVEKEIRYVGIEFGIGAYRPRPAESTLAQGQGDCKDMTALMVSLLGAMGIDAFQPWFDRAIRARSSSTIRRQVNSVMSFCMYRTLTVTSGLMRRPLLAPSEPFLSHYGGNSRSSLMAKEDASLGFLPPNR